MDRFLGEIIYVSFTKVPTDYHKCDGTLLSIRAYPALFSLMGTTYGGDGINDFALPNLPTPAGHQHGNYLIAISTGIYPS
jgi:microcystin-dependent protein